MKPSIIYLAIIFEKFDAVGAQFLLDLNFLRDKVTARRASSNSVPPNLQIGNFPSVVLFQRNQSRPIFISMYVLLWMLFSFFFLSFFIFFISLKRNAVHFY